MNLSTEEIKMLNHLRLQQRRWLVVRWVALLFLLIGFPLSAFLDRSKGEIMGLVLYGLLVGYVIANWNGDIKSKLLIKLYEEKYGAKNAEKS